MGGGSWSDAVYTTASATRAATGTLDFAYDSAVKTGKATGIHADLDPSKVAGPASPFAGKPIRESRDIPGEHEESLPIAVFFDVTGSMGHIPRTLQKKLSALMDVVKSKANIQDPQVLMGAIGDSTCDRYPFQVGQFESDNRFDEQLRNIIIEGGGGGQNKESYGLAYRFAAYHTATDSFEKRGKKGYLFTIGDETFWPTITAEHVKSIFGVEEATDESVVDLLAKSLEQWEVFHLHAQQGSYKDSAYVLDPWRALLGERLILVDDADLICEVIAGKIHSIESSKTADEVVKDIGLTGRDADVVKNALMVVKTNVPAHVAEGNLPAASGSIKRTMSRV